VLSFIPITSLSSSPGWSHRLGRIAVSQIGGYTNLFDLSDEHVASILICTREAFKTFIYSASHDEAVQGTLLARIWKQIMINRTQLSTMVFDGQEHSIASDLL